MAVASPEDLKVAYLLGRNNNNELTKELLNSRGWSTEKVLKVLNTLVEKRLGFLKHNKTTGKSTIKVREESVAQAIRTLSQDDYLVYCCLEDAGNTGMWTQDIGRATKLQTHAVQRAVKNLSESKKLIKQFKTIHQKNKKMFILANLEPSTEVVGGTFYDNAEFDEGLVERLRTQIVHILRNGQQASLADMSSYVKSSGFGKDLSDEDLKLVLRTLQLEQSIQTLVNPGTGETVYSWSRWPDDDPIRSVPCGTCPVFSECIRGGGDRISPTTCKYFDYWLEYETDFDNRPPPPPPEPT